jgi:hypothetical protein
MLRVLVPERKSTQNKNYHQRQHHKSQSEEEQAKIKLFYRREEAKV